MRRLGPGPQALLERVIRFIDQHLGDPELAPAGIAQVHHISVRYLHGEFRARHLRPDPSDVDAQAVAS